MFELRTTHLILRDFVTDDWTAIFAMSQAPVVTQYQSWLRLASEQESQHWVQQAIHHNRLQPRETFNLAIVHQDTDTVIGWIGWGRPSDRTRGDYDFGYALLPDTWGHGYMTEALQAALDYMFETLAARVVYGECAKSNRASARVMEKSGLRLISQWSEVETTTGTSQVHERYAIQVGEWQQRHQGAVVSS